MPFALSAIAALCRGLLAEGVPLREFRRIAEAMLDCAAHVGDRRALLDSVRARIGTLIVQSIVPARMPLPAITLAPDLEALLGDAVRIAPDAAHPFEPQLAARVTQAIGDAAAPMLATAANFAVVTSPAARAALARLLRPYLPDVPVLSFLEIPDAKAVNVIAVVGRAEQLAAPAQGAE